MEEKDRGRAFLFSKYYGFIDNEDEDGDYQIYSDGSGYYHGSDGSEGHIYSDGTGRFRGADGSTGHRNSDGSGYFEDEYGDTVRYDSYSERENESNASEEKDFVSGITEILLDVAFKAGAAAIKNGVAKAKEQARQEEAEQLEAQRIEEERKKTRKICGTGKEKRTQKKAYKDDVLK